MTHEGNQQDEGGTDQPQVEYAWDRTSKTKIRVMARFGGTLIHANAFDPNNATARATFAAAVAQRLAKGHQVTVAVQDVEQQLLLLIEEMDQAGDDDATAAEYQVVQGDDDPEKDGIYRVSALGPVQLCNFAMSIDRDVTTLDGAQVDRRFEGRIVRGAAESPFAISADDYPNGSKFLSAVFRAAGVKARVLCKPEALCRAVSALSNPVSRVITADLGWDPDGIVYLSKGVRIDAAGVHTVGPDDPLRLDLGDEQCARYLDLATLAPEALAETKAHVVGDLLRLSERRVTFLLLAAVALAVLYRFAGGMNRPAIWLTGMTGGGKSFLGRLFANFFGDFPVADGSRHPSWSSTANFIQKQGYLYKDSMYLVDDYKPEVIPHREVVKILQNYADNSARGRLRADATTNVSRPIRGILVSTGEDVPEHSASSVARTVVVQVPQAAKDIFRGRRCVERAAQYRGVTAAFIHHLIANGRTGAFAARVASELDFFYAGIAGRQNDVRIAGNFALLMAAFLEIAEFLGDVWPNRQQEAELFRADLLAIRGEMLAEVRDQQASEVFLATLRALMVHGHVQVKNWQPGLDTSAHAVDRPKVGRKVVLSPCQGCVFDISTSLALGAVQDALRKQGKPPLAATEKALIGQMVGDGKLLDKENQPIPPQSGGDHTWAVKVAGATRNVFRIRESVLFGEEPAGTGEAGDGG